MKKQHKAQALVTLLVFTATALIITTAAVTVTLINALAADKFAQGEQALHIAEAGADNAVLRLLRNPNYTGESNLAIGSGTATITVTGTTTKTIVSEGTTGNFKRKIQAVGTFSGNVFTVGSWSEID